MRDTSVFQSIWTDPGVHLPNCSMGTRIPFCVVLFDFSPLISAKVKMLWSVPPLSHLSCHVRGQFYFFPVW